MEGWACGHFHTPLFGIITLHEAKITNNLPRKGGEPHPGCRSMAGVCCFCIFILALELTWLLLYFNEDMVFYTLLNGHVLRSSACLSKQKAPFQCAGLGAAPSSDMDNAV